MVGIGSVIAVALIFWLSNLVPTHNGHEVIVNPDVYRMKSKEAADLAQGGVSSFNMGQEITPQQHQDLEKAAGLFDSLDDFKATESAGYFEAALCYYLIGDTDRALNRVQQSLNNAAVNPPLATAAERSNLEGVVGDCHHLLSLIAFDRKDYRTAIKESSLAMDHRKDRPLYYVARARAEIELSSQHRQLNPKASPEDLKLDADAKSDLSAALKIYPAFPPALALMKLIQ